MSQLAVKAIPVQIFASASLTGSYQVINTAGLDHSCFTVRIVNASSTQITISYDGTNDNDVLLSNTSLQLPLPINTLPNSRGAQFRQGTKVFVKGTAGTGSIYLIGYYTS